MVASPLDSVDTLKNLHFDDCLCFGYIFPLNDASVDFDDCLHGPHMHHYILAYYLYYNSYECFGCGALVYFGVFHLAGHIFRGRLGHLHIYRYFGHHNGYHNDHSDCPVCVYYLHGYVPVHHYLDV